MAGGFADESRVLEIGFDYKQVIQNLFLEVINKIPRTGIAAKAMPLPADGGLGLNISPEI